MGAVSIFIEDSPFKGLNILKFILYKIEDFLGDENEYIK